MNTYCWEVIYTNRSRYAGIDQIVTYVLAQTEEQAYEKALKKAEKYQCASWDCYTIKVYNRGVIQKIRYSNFYKDWIRGDCLCPFWNSTNHGTCMAKHSWEECKMPCTAQKDGSQCPVFDKGENNA